MRDLILILLGLVGVTGAGFFLIQRPRKLRDRPTLQPVSVIDPDPPAFASPSITWSPPAKAAPYMRAFTAAENANALPRYLLARIALQESNYNPNARGAAGEIGMMQFLPATAADFNIDPSDPFQAIEGAGRYFRWLFDRTGSWTAAITAYNWGIGNVQRKGVNAAPGSTKMYVAAITADVAAV